MPQAQHTVTISRPADAVFAFVADGETGPRWRTGILDIKHISGQGVGSAYRQGTAGPMGRRIAADYEITTFDPDRLLEFRGTAGPIRPSGRYVFEEVDGGTRLTFSLSAELGMLQRVFMGSMVSRTMESEVASLEKLKRVLEA